MAQASLLERARQGDAQAIATLLNRVLEPLGIVAALTVSAETLHLTLEAASTPEASTVLPVIYRGLLQLQIATLRRVEIRARASGGGAPAWSEQIANHRGALLKGLAQQGDEAAMQHLLNRAIAHKQLTSRVHVAEEQLQVLLEGDHLPEPAIAVMLVQREVASWQALRIDTIEIHARYLDEDAIRWVERVDNPRWVPSSLPLPDDTLPATIPPATPERRSPQRRSPSPIPAAARATLPRSPQRPSPTPGWTFQFEPLKIGFVALLLAYGILNGPNYTVSGFLEGGNFLMMFLHGVNLIFHEAGHTLFMMFGRFLHILGGSLMQILVPAIISSYFFYTKQPYAGAIALCWVGENFWDVSIYIKDAQHRLLPLLGGEGVMHDWHFLLLDLRLLTKDQLIGGIAYNIGTLLYGFAIFMGVYYAQIQPTKPTESLR